MSLLTPAAAFAADAATPGTQSKPVTALAHALPAKTPAKAAPALAPSFAGMTPARAAMLRPILKFGDTGNPAIVYVQQRFGIRPATGSFGPLTLSKVRSFQGLKKIPQTGNIGPLTWGAIFSTPGIIHVPGIVDGIGPRPTVGRPPAARPPAKRPPALRVPPKKVPATKPRAGKPAVKPLPTIDPMAGLSPAAAARMRPRLEAGMGPGHPAVKFVQQRLGVKITGFFGPVTLATVKAYQTGLKLPVTGVVGPLTWAAIHAGRMPSGGLHVTVQPTDGNLVATPGANGDTAPPPAPLRVWPTGRPNPAVRPGDSPQTTAIRFALAQVGEQYVLGGVGPDVWDCSGLLQMAYARAGKSLPRIATAQYIATQPVERADIRPGDLVFTTTVPGRMSHVGMYIGNGNIVEAANSRVGVVITPMTAPWIVEHFQAIGRVL